MPVLMPMLLLLLLLLSGCPSGPSVLLRTAALYPTLEPVSRCRVAPKGASVEAGQVFMVTLEGVRTPRRVVGLPGDSVEVKSGVLFINGKSTFDTTTSQRTPCFAGISAMCTCRIHDESFNGHDYSVQTLIAPNELTDARCIGGPDFGPHKVAKGTVFLLADNRDAAHDSRHMGSIDSKKLEERVVACKPAR